LYACLAKAHGLDRYGKINIEVDPRVTKFGRLLRKFRVDELPQLFVNVPIKRDMSLVGIRPRDDEEWGFYPEDHKKRALQYKPGFMGVNYLNDGPSFPDMIEVEKRYLDEKEIHPFLTDTIYASRLLYRIIFRGVKSY
jgi:lipopolysaccharide/colanic/teichoic acid biosynthesis glycosyltransferase